MENIGEKIKQLRKSRGLSLMELSEILNVSDTALSKIERGKVDSIKIDFGKKLCKELGVSFNELFEIEKSSENELKEEISKLNKRIAELEESNSDKKELNKIFRDTTEYYNMFFKHLLINISDEIHKKLSSKELVKKINDDVRKEMGEYVVLDDNYKSFQIIKVEK